MNTGIEDYLYNTHAGSQWRKIGVRHHHGICLPLFSLHSATSSGVGEFLDLLPLIKWCKSVGLGIIQLLPLNDPGQDTSPYNAISAFALNPIHLSLHTLPGIENIPDHQEKISHLRHWNRTARVKYSVVRELKKAFLKDYYHALFEDVETTSDYHTFLQQNEWITAFSLFKALKESHQWTSWEEWPNAHKSPSQSSYEDLLKEYKEEIHYHSFVQYLCYRQFEHVREVAEKEGVLIKGDIPILISRDSADVWAERSNFLLNLAAGAPPDMYAKEGQYWGFPLYDWEWLEKTDYRWWRKRLQIASDLYQLYRIDHIVGFFRIWGIPLGRSAREGAFVPSDEGQWIAHGRKIMEMMLHAAPILPIGEDLGVVPPSVKKCLSELGICGTRMMRWERRWDTDGGFIPANEYHPESMTTVSTHDSNTIQLWWRHFPKEARLFCEFKKWDYRPFLDKERHREILWDSHHSTSLFHINLLQEYLALFPELISPNPNDERINIPGKILETNWTYRFRPSIEQLIEHAELSQMLKNLINPGFLK